MAYDLLQDKDVLKAEFGESWLPDIMTDEVGSRSRRFWYSDIWSLGMTILVSCVVGLVNRTRSYWKVGTFDRSRAVSRYK